MKYLGTGLFLRSLESVTIKEILKEDVTTYADNNDLPQQYYFINEKERLAASYCDGIGTVFDHPMQFSKRYRKFKTLSVKQFIKECE